MRQFLQRLQDIVSGRNVFICGNGPSIDDISPDLLSNKKVIAINDNIEKFTNAIALFWMDSGWADARHRIVEPATCIKISSRRNLSKQVLEKDLRGAYGEHMLNHVADNGMTADINGVCGNNSGMQVINLCANLKASNIILLGFDMKSKNRKLRGGSFNYVIPREDVYKDLFIPALESMAPHLERAGVNVINCTPDSALKCFPADTLENWI